MENLHNDYPYLALDATQNEIRLLELLPRGCDFEGRVQARLVHQSLNQAPKYDALSYVWGNTLHQTTIILDDREFAVTENLERALRDVSRFQSRDNEVLVIWVDAICINQRDFEERNAQVKIMWEIYANAEKVRTWLDAEIPDQVYWTLVNQICNNITSVDDLGKDPDFWEPLGAILKNPYWSRVWVQQEIAYAKDMVIHCRGMPIPHSILVWFFEVLDMHNHKYRPVMENIEDGKWHGLAAGSHRFEKNKSGRVENPRCYKTVYDALTASHLKATDTRDRVFGLLALIQDDVDDVKISYELPVSEVYHQVVRFLLEKYHSLAFLNLGGLNISSEHSDLPTWLPYPRGHPRGVFGPDIDMSSGEFAGHQALLSPITRSTAIPPPFFFIPHGTLHVHGMCLSQIGGVCQRLSWRGSHRLGNFLQDWDYVMNRWVSINGRESPLTKTDHHEIIPLHFVPLPDTGSYRAIPGPMSGSIRELFSYSSRRKHERGAQFCRFHGQI